MSVIISITFPEIILNRHPDQATPIHKTVQRIASYPRIHLRRKAYPSVRHTMAAPCFHIQHKKGVFLFSSATILNKGQAPIQFNKATIQKGPESAR